ncbi:hypothetical protein, partial [Acinetobacter baumannii]|uniref:hypothetical protein n=1 Tax=Acinetobacter baumannii TaxID=470 RepID=UPI001C08C4CC
MDPEDLFGRQASDADGDADPENSEDAAAPQPARIRLADGTEATAEQIQEWRDAGLRTADYTRKTQEVAEH